MDFLLSPKSNSNSGSPLSSSPAGNSPVETGITGPTSRRENYNSSQSTLREEGENGELLTDETRNSREEPRDRKGKGRQQQPYDQDYRHGNQSMTTDIETINGIPGAFRSIYDDTIGPTPMTQTTRLDHDTTFGIDIPRPNLTFDLSLDLDILRTPGARTTLTTDVSSGFGFSSGFSSPSTPVLEESRGATVGNSTGPRSMPEPEPPKSVLKRRPDDVQSDWNATPGPSTRIELARTPRGTYERSSRLVSSSGQRRSSRTESRRRRDRSRERGISRDFLLIIALCVGLASASVLIVRPALYKFYGWDDTFGSYDTTDWDWAAEVEL